MTFHNQKNLSVLRKRADFVAASASGFKCVKPTLIVQLRKRAETEPSESPIRIGFTATKTLGNAFIRNKVKRRLRAAAAALAAEHGTPGCDYVFIGRKEAYKAAFDDLIRDMKHALKRLAQMIQ